MSDPRSLPDQSSRVPTDDERAARRRAFPWPGTGQFDDCVTVIEQEHARREAQRRHTSIELFGHEGAHIARLRPLTTRELVLLVVWTLRGDRWPDSAAPDEDSAKTEGS